MSSGILLTVLISLLIGFFGVMQFYVYRRAAAREYRTELARSFALFWLFLGFVLIFTAINNFFVWLRVMEAAWLSIYFAQISLAVTLVLASWHIAYRLFLSQTFVKTILCVYSFAALVFCIQLLRYGFEDPKISFFSIEIRPNPGVVFVYTVMFLPLFAAVLYDLARFMWQLLKKKNSGGPLFRFRVLSAVSLFILALAGTMDELSLVYGWALAAARLCTLAGSMAAYFAVAELREPAEELVV